MSLVSVSVFLTVALNTAQLVFFCYRDAGIYQIFSEKVIFPE